MLPATDLLAASSIDFTTSLQATSDIKIEKFKSHFDRGYAGITGARDGNLFIFHVAIPKENQKIEYPDITIDHGDYDYDQIIAKSISNTLRLFSNLRIVFVSNDDSCPLPKSDRVIRVNINVNPAEPVYERVYAMAAYVRSRMFDRPTVFLDSDTFLGLDPTPIFKHAFDIGVSKRSDPGFMPVNEGVIYVNNRQPDLVKAFFDAYAATYERLTENSFFKNYYGNIKRWRGGQLSLNTVIEAFLSNKAGEKNSPRAKIGFLPSEIFNFSFENNVDYSDEYLDRVCVFHLKGNRKTMVDSLLSYFDEKPVIGPIK